ncbi:DNA cytosine methyltransferase [Streptomyces flavidovirens]|uniref:DNA cytosine methyltransferase n=1 Tax=Streptomyces flavidovirens TaxID=67298 RepID=UPI0036C666C9
MNVERTREPIRIANLFAGCGGFTQGFYSFRPEGEDNQEESFFKSVLAMEKEPGAAATYAANSLQIDSHKHVHTEDIKNLSIRGGDLR